MARDACAAEGADLVMIKSPETQKYVGDVSKREIDMVWIGINFDVEESAWKFVDGTPVC